MKPAVFLDRDGVLIEDVGPLGDIKRARILPGTSEALSLLAKLGYRLVVVSNQTVIARGLASELEVREIQNAIESQLENEGAPSLDGFYFCPHHPNATDPAFRQECQCRKPRPGLIIQASRELDLDLGRSFFVGDRPTDIMAGAAAGCRTVLVTTGQHTAPLIETCDPLEDISLPEYVASDLLDAARWIGSAA